MRKLVVLLMMSVAVGCDGVAPPTADVDRGPPDSPLLAVETYAFAVNQRDQTLYVSLLTQDFETVNDSGQCLDWLDPSYWESRRPDVCGALFVRLELVVTNERLLAGPAVEIVASAVFLRDSAESAGASTDHVMVLTVEPSERGYLIRQVHVLEPVSLGT